MGFESNSLGVVYSKQLESWLATSQLKPPNIAVGSANMDL
jgi:hypothetical protein